MGTLSGKRSRGTVYASPRRGFAAMDLIHVMGCTLAIGASLWLLLVPAIAGFHRLARVIAGWPF